MGTSNNCHQSSGAPNLPTNDSALFSFRFRAVHPKDVRDCQLRQLFEVPFRLFRLISHHIVLSLNADPPVPKILSSTDKRRQLLSDHSGNNVADTRWKAPPCHGAHPKPTSLPFSSGNVGRAPCRFPTVLRKIDSAQPVFPTKISRPERTCSNLSYLA